jgi:transcription antitermination factor NusG
MLSPGDTVQITAGRMEGFVGRVDSLGADGATARVLVRLFGRETPLDVPANDLATCEPARTTTPMQAKLRPDPTAILDEE